MNGRRWVAGGVLGLAMLACAGARAETLIIQGDVWCPVNCNEKDEQPGIFVELAREIFAEAGIEVEYRTTNWARAVQDVRSGRVNGLIGAGVRDAPDLMFGKEAAGVSRMCFYAREENPWRYTDMASLEHVRLGAINGYSYGEEIDHFIEQHHSHMDHLQMASGEQGLAQNVRKVELGRLDITVENTWVMANFLSRHDTGADLIEVGCRAGDLPIYIAFSPVLPTSARYRDIFDEGLRRYRENGHMDAILLRYGIKHGQ